MKQNFEGPGEGQWITVDEKNQELQVPENPIIGYIEGDGVGPDIWAASRPVFDSVIEKVLLSLLRIF